MAHIHNVVDTDTHYMIDSKTREIANSFEVKKIIGQYDHKSERLTFEIPRYFDGHDFFECNVVKIYYTNSDDIEKQKNSGEYEVTDKRLKEGDENTVIFSWLIEMESTSIAGFIEFNISFQCVINGNVDYSWNSALYRLTVIKGRTLSNNASAIQIAIENTKKECCSELEASLETVTGENYDGKTWEELNEVIKEMSLESFIEPMLDFFEEYDFNFNPGIPGGPDIPIVDPDIPIDSEEGGDENVTE